jgi:hypothetical protein
MKQVRSGKRAVCSVHGLYSLGRLADNQNVVSENASKIDRIAQPINNTTKNGLSSSSNFEFHSSYTH